MLRGILEIGYSFHWKVMPAEKYGVPQLRKRLILLVAWLIRSSQDLIIVPANLCHHFLLQPMVSPGFHPQFHFNGRFKVFIQMTRSMLSVLSLPVDTLVSTCTNPIPAQ